MLNFNKVQIKGKDLKESPQDNIDINFNEKELEFLLVTIKNTLFKGEYVELLFNLTLKIQENYLKLKEKK